jgi:regulator of protease activity HflC (stomatin/prohibitin superfamily)
MIIKILWWLFFLIAVTGPIVIPWWWSLYVSWCLFTTLDTGTSATGAIRVQNGKEIEVSYTNKEGILKTGYLTSGGTYDGVILPWGYQLKDCEEPELRGKQEIEKFNEPFNKWSYSSQLRRHGIYWIGFPPCRRLSYRFVWTEFSKVIGHEGEVVRREEPTNFFFVARAEYAITTKDVEIGGDTVFPVDLDFSVFIRIVVPEVAFSGNVDVLAQLGKILKTEADTFFRPIQYENLKTIENQKLFSKVIKKIRTKIILGIEIEEVRLSNVGGEVPETIRTAYQATLVATKTGDAAIIAAEKAGRATVVTAKAKAEAKNLDTDAEKRRIHETYDEKSKYPELARLEALEKSGAGGNTVVFEGNGQMSDDTKKMLVVTSRIRPKDKVEQPEDATKIPENKPTDRKGKKRGGKNDSSK